MNTPPQSPRGLRAGNLILSSLNKLGLAGCSLQPDDLLRTARKRTRLKHLGDTYSREALERLSASMDNEAELTPIGRLLTRELLVTGLSNQLKLEDWFSRHPEIAQQDIAEPIIIIGMPRTGTTILHELMALDPANRVPQTWEVASPFPPPEHATYETDPRIKEEQTRLKVSHYLMPGVENMHRMGAQLPQECVAITSDVFLTMLYTTIYHIPSYAEWLANAADMSIAYRYHRRMHQLLQWRTRQSRWVLKSPGHLWSLEALLTEYPDARLVQTHRDPLKITSSLASMVPTMRSAYQYKIDAGAVASEWANTNALALNASLRARQSGAIRPEQIIDIQFSDFIQSPERAVESIYRKFDLEFTPQLADVIRQYIADNPADKHGGHKHYFSDTGLDAEKERARVYDYQAYFNVLSESLK